MNKRLQLHAYLLLVCILVKIFQTNAMSMLKISAWTPDLGMIFAFLISHYVERRYGMLYGFFYGLIHDLSGTVLGINSLSKTLGAYVAGFFKYNEVYNHTTFVTGLFLSCFVSNLITYGVLSYGLQNFFDVVLEFVIPSTMYTLLVGLLLYFLFESILKRLYDIREQF